MYAGDAQMHVYAPRPPPAEMAAAAAAAVSHSPTAAAFSSPSAHTSTPVQQQQHAAAIGSGSPDQTSNNQISSATVPLMTTAQELPQGMFLTVIWVPTPPGKSGIFFLKIPGPGKSWRENHCGPGKSWKLKLKVLESPGKISLKVMHFSSGLNGKQAAIV